MKGWMEAVGIAVCLIIGIAGLIGYLFAVFDTHQTVIRIEEKLDTLIPLMRDYLKSHEEE